MVELASDVQTALGMSMQRCPSAWHAVRDDGVLVHADDDFHWQLCHLAALLITKPVAGSA